MIKKNAFIAFEGTDGSGKSTQIALLANALEEAGIRVALTKEPTDADIGKLLRSYLKGERITDHRAIAPLFAADRLDHITAEGGILDLLSKGNTVLCDRYYLSSYAYQGLNCDIDWVIEVNRKARELARPDLHIFLDLPCEISMERVKNRGETEIFEQLEQQKRIRDNFYMLFEKLKDEENILIIDASRSPEEIAKEIRSKVLCTE
ncbi:MAG: dTMP kinase [Ruminococcaceae bacterium]|nr:dTMP kinase [Oscillospiraceae bacterium]